MDGRKNGNSNPVGTGLISMVINNYGNLPSPVRPTADKGNLSVSTEAAGMARTGLVARRSSQAIGLKAYPMFTCRQCKPVPTRPSKGEYAEI